jgi:hypothetical protein
MQKDILFFSNYCEFCKEILGMITKNNLKEQFMMVCVDNKQLRLPPFVDRVPIIYTSDKKLFSDENLINYIQTKVVTTTLQPYALVGTNTGAYSENFSFIETGDNLAEDFSINYNYLGMDQQIYAPKEDDDSNNKVQSNVLEKYMADRANDIAKILPNSTGFNRL